MKTKRNSNMVVIKSTSIIPWMTSRDGEIFAQVSQVYWWQEFEFANINFGRAVSTLFKLVRCYDHGSYSLWISGWKWQKSNSHLKVTLIGGRRIFMLWFFRSLILLNVRTRVNNDFRRVYAGSILCQVERIISFKVSRTDTLSGWMIVNMCQ